MVRVEHPNRRAACEGAAMAASVRGNHFILQQEMEVGDLYCRSRLRQKT